MTCFLVIRHLLRQFSHRVHSAWVVPPTDCTDLHRTACRVEPPTDCTEFTETLAEWSLPQIAQIYTELLVGDVLPQIAQICTELLAGDILPQNTQISQNFLLRMFSHRFHRFTQMVRLRKIVAEVSLPPQQQSASHRFHRSAQNFLLGIFSHRIR